MNTIPAVTRSVLIGLGLIIASTGAHAKVYRCVVNGNTTYSDRPCEGTDSETVNMVAPAAKAAPAAKVALAAKAGSAIDISTDKPTATPAPPVPPAPPATPSAAAPAATPASKSAASGNGWHLAGEYSDRVRNSSKTLKRASYGVECDVSRRRPFVYAINGRYSLTAPSHNGTNQLQGPYYDSLDAAAAAACTAK